MKTVPNRPDSRFRWAEYPEYPVKKRVQGTVPPFCRSAWRAGASAGLGLARRYSVDFHHPLRPTNQRQRLISCSQAEKKRKKHSLAVTSQQVQRSLVVYHYQTANWCIRISGHIFDGPVRHLYLNVKRPCAARHKWLRVRVGAEPVSTLAVFLLLCPTFW